MLCMESMYFVYYVKTHIFENLKISFLSEKHSVSGLLPGSLLSKYYLLFGMCFLSFFLIHKQNYQA